MGDAIVVPVVVPAVVPEPGIRHAQLVLPEQPLLPRGAQCRVQRSGELSVVELVGELPRDWSVNLTRALAARGLSLVNGHARELAPGAWQVRLELDPGYGGAVDLDFLALASRATQAPPLAEPKLLDFELSPTTERSFYLEVHAWDAVGLLASVLDRVTAAGLRPTELLLETEAECAFHSMQLAAAGSRPAGPRQSRLLALALTRLLIED